MFYSWNVIGHEKELQSLENDLRSDSISHAYLFVGPEKIGKFRVVKAMAGILQCPNDFCHTCPTCIQIEKKCHPDTIELEDDGESVKLETIKEIIARLNMTGQSKHKVLLIQNIGRLTDEAGNCLLKTLEEPPGKTIFLFSVDQLRDVMPTIASRMRVIHFKKLPDEVLKDSLQKLYPDVDEKTLDQVLLLSLGRSGRAIQLLSNPEAFRELHELYQNIQFLEGKALISTRIMNMQILAQDPKRTKLFLSLLVHHLRRKMLQDISPEEKKRLIKTIEGIHECIGLLARNVNPRLLLENIMINI